MMWTRKDRIRRVARRAPLLHRLAPSFELCEDRVLLANAAVSLTLSVSNATPDIGSNITYTIKVTDAGGAADATNVKVTDNLPVGLKFVSTSQPAGVTFSNGVWTISSLPNGTTDTLTLTAQVLIGATKTDTASITSLDQANSGSPTSASVDILPNEVSLTIQMALDSPTPNIKNPGDVGDKATFTIIVTNQAGFATATGVKVTDLLPAGLNFVSASSGSYNSGSGVWDVGTINGGTAATLQITVTSSSLSTITNVARITGVNQLDANANGDQSASQSITAQEINLSVTESADNLAPGVGTTVTFTTVLSNAAGLSTAHDVAVTQNLPSGLSFLSASSNPPGISYNSGAGIWNVGDLASGSSVTLTLKATVITTATRTVTSIASASQYDLNSDPRASVTLIPPQIDLSLAAAVSNSTPNVGDQITYTFTLGNAAGFSNATGVHVDLTSPLPAGLTFVNSNPSVGSYSNTTGIWTVGSLNSGTSATLTLTVAVTTPATKTLTATAHADQTDANLNPTASVTVTPLQANLSVSQTVDNPTPVVGGTVTFTVGVSEAAGFSKATGITVGDLLPAGLTFVQAIPSQGTYSQFTGAWAVGTVGGGATATLKILAIDNVAAVPITNTATLTHVDQSNLSVNTTASATVTARQANLGISNSVDNPNPNVGANVTFTVTITNLGGSGFSATTDSQVTDLLPAGLSFVSSTATQGTYNGTTGVWSVGGLGLGSSATLHIVAQVTNGGTITDTAKITDSVPTNTNVNNTASASITAPSFSLSDLSAISYLINGTKTVTSLAGNVQQGDRVQVSFTVAAGHTDPVSLVSYIVPGTSFFVNSTGQQTVFQSATGSFGPGPHTLTVTVPNSFFQLDLVFGPVISLPGSSGATASYASQGRLIAGTSGGYYAFGPSTISGSVYLDSNNDGVREWYEAGIANSPVELKGHDYRGNAVDMFTTTNYFGNYTFNNVPASDAAGYTIVDLLSQTPLSQQYVGGMDTAGSLGGMGGNGVGQIAKVVVNSNQTGQNYNFGEKKK